MRLLRRRVPPPKMTKSLYTVYLIEVYSIKLRASANSIDCYWAFHTLVSTMLVLFSFYLSKLWVWYIFCIINYQNAKTWSQWNFPNWKSHYCWEVGGLKQKLIAQHHGISPSAVCKIKYKFIRTGDVNNLPRSGRPKVTTDADRYAREILEPHVLPVAGAIDPERFVLVDDNARPHRAHRADSFLEDHGISRMDWSACSPDMNPIENVWGLLKRKISRLLRPEDTIQDLENALIREWNDLLQDHIDKCVLSMRRRTDACVRAMGS